MGLFSHLIRHAQGIRRMGAAALDLAYVAAGRFDAFFEFGLKPWDVAAGALILEEAGAVCRRIDGKPLELTNGSLFASNRGLEAPLGRQIRAFLRRIRWRPTDPTRGPIRRSSRARR